MSKVGLTRNEKMQITAIPTSTVDCLQSIPFSFLYRNKTLLILRRTEVGVRESDLRPSENQPNTLLDMKLG